MSEPSAERRATKQRLGAAHVTDAAVDDLGAIIKEATDSMGVGVAFDAVSVGAATLQAPRLVAPGGSLVVVATRAAVQLQSELAAIRRAR